MERTEGHYDMSNRKIITILLKQLLEKKIDKRGNYWAKEVTFNYGYPEECRVDYMKFEPQNNSPSGLEKGIFICYEIKSSVEDFRSHSGHNFLGEKNYYVMPVEVYLKTQKEIPFSIGVYCPIPNRKTIEQELESPTDIYKITPNSCEIFCIKKARSINRKYSNLTCLFNMFRSGK